MAAAAGGTLPLDVTLEQIEAKYRRGPQRARAFCWQSLKHELLRWAVGIVIGVLSCETRRDRSASSLFRRGDPRLVEVERKTLQARLDARMVPALQEEKNRLRERAAAVWTTPEIGCPPAKSRLRRSSDTPFISGAHLLSGFCAGGVRVSGAPRREGSEPGPEVAARRRRPGRRPPVRGRAGEGPGGPVAQVGGGGARPGGEGPRAEPGGAGPVCRCAPRPGAPCRAPCGAALQAIVRCAAPRSGRLSTRAQCAQAFCLHHRLSSCSGPLCASRGEA